MPDINLQPNPHESEPALPVPASPDRAAIPRINGANPAGPSRLRAKRGFRRRRTPIPTGTPPVTASVAKPACSCNQSQERFMLIYQTCLESGCR